MKRIVIIFPYFGPLPAQFNMWYASALRNPSIDFMFFTDTDVEPSQNIIVHKMKFSDFQEKVERAFDFPITLDRPYKLCEYKQAYGYILQEYIKEYDFWGYGDLDLVYGDIRHFITEDVLRKKFILGWGHLTLLKNEEDTNTYFMKQEPGYQNYKDAFTTNTITFFDEFNHKGCSDKWRDCRPDCCWLKEPFDNILKPKESYHMKSLNRGWQQVLFEHKDNKLYIIRHLGNGLFEKQESLYAHFQHRPFMRDHVKDYNHFLVTPDAVIDYPKHYVSFWLRYYSRSRYVMTLFYQWRDRIIWKLHLSRYK